MSDTKLFRFNGSTASELTGHRVKLEKELQTLIEKDMETFLGVRFLKSEYGTGKTHKGRIDSLGLDENNCPVIIEYKRHNNENVINQGLFYLDWLLNHHAEFQWLVMETFGKEIAEQIEWTGTRLICIASDFNKHDQHAVQQIDRNIELIRYRFFDPDLLLLELVNARTASVDAQDKISLAKATVKSKGKDKTHREKLTLATEPLLKLYGSTCEFIDGLGDDVQRTELKHYLAFKRITNFACIVVFPSVKDPKLQLYLKTNPANFALKEGFSRDVSGIGHLGTGHLQLTLRNFDDLERATVMIEASYRGE